jgi:hypothetical protein
MYNTILLYLDPGSGSLFFQAILSGILTLIVFYKRIIMYIKGKFGKDKDRENTKND